MIRLTHCRKLAWYQRTLSWWCKNAWLVANVASLFSSTSRSSCWVLILLIVVVIWADWLMPKRKAWCCCYREQRLVWYTSKASRMTRMARRDRIAANGHYWKKECNRSTCHGVSSASIDMITTELNRFSRDAWRLTRAFFRVQHLQRESCSES